MSIVETSTAHKRQEAGATTTEKGASMTGISESGKADLETSMRPVTSMADPK